MYTNVYDTDTTGAEVYGLSPSPRTGGLTQTTNSGQLGYVTGIPRVRNSNTAPVTVYTVPVSGTGTYRTHSAAVSYETRGIFGTHGLLV